MGELTKAQLAVLSKLAARDTTKDGCPSGAELSRMMGHRLKDWATPKLKALEKRGFVEKMGVTFDNARCWAATEAGRAALEKNDGL